MNNNVTFVFVYEPNEEIPKLVEKRQNADDIALEDKINELYEETLAKIENKVKELLTRV